jgi:hypothetical protein
MLTQSESLVAKQAQLINSERLLKASQSREVLYWVVIGSLLLYAILN